MSYPIKPVDTVRKAGDLLPADLEGVEGRWLDVPRLQQKNPDENQSNYWCGRASASMVLNYYLKFQGKADQYVGHDDGPQGVGPNGNKKNLRFLGGPQKGKFSGVNEEGRCWPEGALKLLGWTTDSGDLVSSLDGIDPQDDAQVEKIFSRHLDQLKKNNPLVQYTQLTKNRGHIVVICGYKKDAKGKLWLRIVDPCYPHKDLMGSGNFQMIKEASADASFAEYWLKASRLVSVYPGRSTRIFSHADAQKGHFEYAIPDKPVPDDNELVHLLKRGGADDAPAAGSSSGSAGSPAAGSSPAPSSPAPASGGGGAPQPAACPPVSGNPRLPFEINGSSVVTGEAITALYHMSERGLGGYFPLGDAGLFHSGAHFAVEQNKPIMAIADGEVVAARLGTGPGEHPWGDTGFVILRHKVKASGAEKNLYSLFMHLKKEPLHPDRTSAPWLKNLLIDACKDKDSKSKWRVMATMPTWKDADKGRFSPANVQNDVLLDPGVYEEQDEAIVERKRYVKLKDKWVRVSGGAGDEGKAKELSPWQDFDIEKAAKNNASVKALKDGKTAVLDAEKGDDKKHKCKVSAGEPVGLSGFYLDGATLHWGMFSKDDVFPSGALPDAEFGESDAVKLAALDLSGKDHGKPEHTKAFIEALDKDKKFLGTKPDESILEPGELRLFYRTPTHCWKARYQAVKGLVDFKLDVQSLIKQDRYKSHTDPEKKSFTDNAKLLIFWDDLASAEEFPTDGKATFVHPATGLRLMSTVSVGQDHDDPAPGDASAADREHPDDDVTMILRDSKGPLAGVNLTVKLDGNQIKAGPTDSAGELLVRLTDVRGKAVEVEVDKGSLDGGQVYNVVNETGSPAGLMPGQAVGEQTTNGSDVVPDTRLGLRVKTTKEITANTGWDDELHKPKGAEATIPKDEYLEIERFVFRRDDGKFEGSQVSRAGQILYFWSIDNGNASIAPAPREEHGAAPGGAASGDAAAPNVIGSWTLRIAHLTDHPVLCGRVMNIGDGEELEVSFCAMLAQGAPEHDVELLKQKTKTAAAGFSIAFDPHTLTQDNQLLNTPRPVFAKVKYKDKEFSLRSQSVTCYGESRITDPGPKPQALKADGPEMEGWLKATRGDHTDQLTLGDKSAPKLVSIHELATDLAGSFIADGSDKLAAGPAALLPHLAVGDEATQPIADAWKHHQAAAYSAQPGLSRSFFPFAGQPWSAPNGIMAGICARDCKDGVNDAGKAQGCNETIRQGNFMSCHTADLPACTTAIQLGSPNKPKDGKCGNALSACGAAHHDKSHCFLTPAVTGGNADERERWYAVLPMQVDGPSFPYWEPGRGNQLKLVVVNPKNGKMVVCSVEGRDLPGKSPGNPAVPPAGITADEFKDKLRLVGVSQETAWQLDLPRTNGDPVVLVALAPANAPLGPVRGGVKIRLKDTAAFAELMS